MTDEQPEPASNPGRQILLAIALVVALTASWLLVRWAAAAVAARFGVAAPADPGGGHPEMQGRPGKGE